MCVSTSSMEVSSSSASRSSEIRKIRKPLMEKKRRARINESLDALQRLLSEAKGEDLLQNRSSKLEKADILEMTVRHLKNLNKQRKTSNKCGCLETTNSNQQYNATSANCDRFITDNSRTRDLQTYDHLPNNFDRCGLTENRFEPQKNTFSLTEDARLKKSSTNSRNSDNQIIKDAMREKCSNNNDCTNVFVNNISSTINNSENISPLVEARLTNCDSDSRSFNGTDIYHGVSFRGQNYNLTHNSSITLVPVKLGDGTIAFVMPSIARLNQISSDKSNSDENNASQSYNNVWRPWF